MTDEGPITRRPEAAAERADHRLNEAEVAAYLRRHPDFLLTYPGLLRVLTPPSHRRGDDVHDFQTFLIARLRDDLELSGTEHQSLVDTSRHNLSGQTRVHQAALALLEATSFEQLVHVVTTDLAVLLDLDVVTLCVEVAEVAVPHAVGSGVFTLRPGAVDELLGARRDIALFAKTEGDAAIFGGGADLVRSCALLRLSFGPKGPNGVIALGTRRDGKFQPGQGTELLGFLARVLEHCVRAWLKLPD